MAAAAPGSENAQSDAAGIDDTRVNLIVLFGGQSAEHDVSCTTAAHVLKAADPQKYRITPIGISRDGTWAVAGGALLALAEGAVQQRHHDGATRRRPARRRRRDGCRGSERIAGGIEPAGQRVRPLGQGQRRPAGHCPRALT